MQKETEQWYTAWFNTPYYHILYKDRDYKEAGSFMRYITRFLTLPTNAEVLDLACGKGRHSKYLNELGYDVTGVDLSENSIAFAKKFENDRLHFEVHDMCLPYPKKFDAVFNLFTSFGYFENEIDNLRTIKAIRSELKPNGYGVIDFLNMTALRKRLVFNETKTVNDIEFYLTRYFEDGYLFKEIRFTHNDERHHYTERVRALTLNNFQEYFNEAGVQLKYCFGDYSLGTFDEEKSERLILIFGK